MTKKKGISTVSEWVRGKVEDAMTTIQVDPAVLDRADMVSVVYAVQVCSGLQKEVLSSTLESCLRERDQLERRNIELLEEISRLANRNAELLSEVQTLSTEGQLTQTPRIEMRDAYLASVLGVDELKEELLSKGTVLTPIVLDDVAARLHSKALQLVRSGELPAVPNFLVRQDPVDPTCVVVSFKGWVPKYPYGEWRDRDEEE